jgi:hypothetical protein
MAQETDDSGFWIEHVSRLYAFAHPADVGRYGLGSRSTRRRRGSAGIARTTLISKMKKLRLTRPMVSTLEISRRMKPGGAALAIGNSVLEPREARMPPKDLAEAPVQPPLEEVMPTLSLAR